MRGACTHCHPSTAGACRAGRRSGGGSDLLVCIYVTTTRNPEGPRAVEVGEDEVGAVWEGMDVQLLLDGGSYSVNPAPLKQMLGTNMLSQP